MLWKKLTQAWARASYTSYRKSQEEYRDEIFDFAVCDICDAQVPVYLTHTVMTLSNECGTHGGHDLSVVVLDTAEIEAHSMLHDSDL